MKLDEFVRWHMREKGLSNIEIERRSNKMVTDSHVATILAGEATNPTLKVLMGLAKALEVPTLDVLKAAAEVDETEEQGWTVQSLTRALQKMLRLSPDEVKELKKLLKI